MYMKPLQDEGQPADNVGMDIADQPMRSEEQMNTDELGRHHDELRDDGFEWCPECGTVLIWDLPTPVPESVRTDRAPVITGDYPPLTAEQLATTTPAPY